MVNKKIVYVSVIAIAAIVIFGTMMATTAIARPPDGGDVCYTLWKPVCGEDGVTYVNKCLADRAGVKSHKGEC